MLQNDAHSPEVTSPREKEYNIEIPNLDPTQPLVLPISPDQIYHNGAIFKALLKYLHAQRVKVILVIADELRRFNFQVEYNEKSEHTPLVKALVEKLKTTWVKENLESDEEMHELVSLMKKEKLLEIHHWDDYKKKHKKTFARSVDVIEKLFEERSALFTNATNVAETFFNNNVTLRKDKNPMVKAALTEKGREGITDIYLKYSREESAMIHMWDELGFIQMAYPCTFHSDKNPSEALFKSVPFRNLQLLNIQVTIKNPSLSSSQSRTRKGSLDGNPQQEFIRKLKEEKRQLQERLETEKRLQKSGKSIIENLENEIAERTQKIVLLESHLQAYETELNQRQDQIRKLKDQNADLRMSLEQQHEVTDEQAQVIRGQRLEINELRNVVSLLDEETIAKTRTIREQERVIHNLADTLEQEKRKHFTSSRRNRSHDLNSASQELPHVGIFKPRLRSQETQHPPLKTHSVPEYRSHESEGPYDAGFNN